MGEAPKGERRRTSKLIRFTLVPNDDKHSDKAWKLWTEVIAVDQFGVPFEHD